MIELLDVVVEAGRFRMGPLCLKISAGQYAVLTGKTGQGKTTLLEVLCGLRKVRSGRVRIDGVDMTDWAPGDRNIGYVPQDLGLFPTMTVQENLAFAMRLRRQSTECIATRTESLAEVLGITHILPRKVRALSGGEAQRVAIGRAISFEPSVLLMDEPLSALDEATRRDICKLLQTVKKTCNSTVLHVTHNPGELAELCDVSFEIAETGQLLAAH